MVSTRAWRVTLTSTRLGLLVFAAAATIGFAAAIVPTPLAHPELTMAGAVAAGLTVVFAIPVLRWPRLPLLTAVMMLYYTAVALLVFGDYGQSEGLLALIAIPVVASALYGPRVLTMLCLVAASAALACDGMVNALSLDDYAQLLVVWPITGIGIAYAIHELRHRLERTIAVREQAIQHDAVLALTADELYSTFDGDQVVQLGLQSAARLTDRVGEPPSCAAFFLVEDEQATLIASYTPGADVDAGANPRIDHLSVPLEATNLMRAVAGGNGNRQFTIDRSTVVPARFGPALVELGVENAMVQVIRIGDQGNGFLVVYNSHADANQYSPVQKEWLRSFAPLLEIAISRALVFDERTTTDSQTGLVNRREVDRRLANMARSTAYSILAIDIDKLKVMNDTYGHPAGDELLQEVAGTLRRSIRRGDTAARVGGDEFCVVLPDAAGHRAEVVAERILADLASRRVHGLIPRVSIGIAAFESGTDATTRLAAADVALYEAKRAGGNRAVHTAPTADHKGGQGGEPPPAAPPSDPRPSSTRVDRGAAA